MCVTECYIVIDKLQNLVTFLLGYVCSSCRPTIITPLPICMLVHSNEFGSKLHGHSLI